MCQFYRDRLRTDDLARAVRISGDRLARVFREGLGITAREFVAEFRLRAACHLLGDGHDKLERVAELTGFDDASHLSRAFTRRLGCDPASTAAGSRARPSITSPLAPLADVG